MADQAVKRRRLAVATGVTILAVAVAGALHDPIASVENQLTRARHGVRGNQAADTNIVLVYVDDDATKTLGWPVRRNFYALLVKALSDLHVKAIGLEPVFEDEKTEYTEYDALLSRVVAASGRVVLTSYFSSLGSPVDTSALPIFIDSVFAFPSVERVVQTGTGIHVPYRLLRLSAASVGHVNLAGETEIPVFIEHGNETVAAFGLELVRIFLNVDRAHVRSDGEVTTLGVGDDAVRIPLSSDGTVALGYRGPLSSFRAYPLVEVLRSYDAVRTGRPATIPVLRFQGKMVLVGVIAEGRSGFLATPVDARLPSLALHATFVDNALQSRFQGSAPAAVVYLLALALGLACALSVLFAPPPWNTLAGFGVPVLLVILSFTAFAVCGFVLPLVLPLTVILSATLGSLLYRHRLVKKTLGQVAAERDGILARLRDREAKVAVLERELLHLEKKKAPDRNNELLEEIRQYKAEIRSLTARADDMEAFVPDREEIISVADEFEGIIYDRTGKMKPVVEFVVKIAGSDAPVLILGESGTGKELIARAIHKRSQRSQGPFVAVNCGALAESLLESELFGHEKGAFTGAVREKPGRFELADGGTIFLDEIGEVSEAFQLKLLRVLQEGEMERVGATKTIRVNVRVVAATNKDLTEAVLQKAFREDLYYRLNVLAVALPPLRERQSDIGLLVEYFLRREGGDLRLSRNVMEALQRYPWRGNVRELESALKRSALMARADRRSMITTKDLTEEIASAAAGAIALEDQVLELLREKGFSRSSVSDTADELGGLNRGTVAEYLRGESLKAFTQNLFDADRAVQQISLSGDEATNDRVRKRLQEYLANIADVVDRSQPWDAVRPLLKPKLKNLPQRYHIYIEQVAEALYRGQWKPRG